MTTRPTVRTVRTADLDDATTTAARALLWAVFDDMTEPDWEHCLGGVHALAYDGDDLVGHAALVERTLHHRGRALRTGYVEGVAVRRDRRGRGMGAAVMVPLEAHARRTCDLAALASTDEALGFYRHRGWLPWRGPTSVLTADGPRRTPDDDDAVLVLPVDARVVLDLDEELTCDGRPGDPW
ncbi:GNAT family N-acetyltransferase [Thalassiella azotivora]